MIAPQRAAASRSKPARSAQHGIAPLGQQVSKWRKGFGHEKTQEFHWVTLRVFVELSLQHVIEVQQVSIGHSPG